MSSLPALLVLEDGRVFRGRSFGAEGETFGELVFSTSMSGYQETLTDPSYHRQVVLSTAPHMGMWIRPSQVLRVSWRMPSPSAPSTRATGPVKSA